MSYTMRELMEMLYSNPELQIDDAYIHQPVIGLARAVPLLRTERDLQQAVIDECDRRAITKPEWGLIFAIPNGQYRQGQRMEPGLRPGVPDLFLPVQRHGYAGFFLELKVGDNKADGQQREWMERLTLQGYRCMVIRDRLDMVIREIERYLESK